MLKQACQNQSLIAAIDHKVYDVLDLHDECRWVLERGTQGQTDA